MSWSWFLYTTKSPKDAVEVERELEAALAAFHDDHDVDDHYAEVGCGGVPPPQPSKIAASYRERRARVPPGVLERLAQCRATMSFDYATSYDDSPLQVSILRFCLDRLAPCVFDWGDHSVELGEDLVRKLARLRSRGALGATAAAPPAKRPVKRRAEKAGEVRAIRIVTALEAAGDDPAAAVDLERALGRLSPGARRYVELVAAEGAMADAAAAKRLAIDLAGLQAIVDEVEVVLDLT